MSKNKQNHRNLKRVQGLATFNSQGYEINVFVAYTFGIMGFGGLTVKC